MKVRSLIQPLILAFLTVPSLLGGVVPGRWEKVETLQEGYAVTVKLESGEEIKASYAGFTEEGLLLKRASGEELEIPKSAVLTVTSQKRVSHDGLGNGAIIGAGVGLGVALAMLGVAASEEGDVLSSAKWGAPLLGIGVGLGAGLAIDAAVKGPELLYQAP
jgi:hypothetical protein